MNLKILLRDLKRLNLKTNYNFGTKRSRSPNSTGESRNSRHTYDTQLTRNGAPYIGYDDVEEGEEVQSNKEECAICYGEILVPTILSCGHKFHRDCICMWFNRPRRTCPLCRRNYTLQYINSICGTPEPRREPLSKVNRISLDPTGRGVQIGWGDDFEN
jgi:hypothetical protein